jgi:FkbM family methyltransferase
VIDVGANKGQFSSFAGVCWPRAKIVAFEPLPQAARRYRRVMGSRSTLYTCALGAAAGKVDLHVASRADSSSLLALGEEQKTLFGMNEIGTIPVEVARLDSVFDGAVKAPALLKIDVQGYEYDVLRGLGNLAEAVDWIYVETSFVELYEGQRLHADVAALLAGLGYEQAGEHNVTSEGGRKIQADVLFCRRV